MTQYLLERAVILYADVTTAMVLDGIRSNPNHCKMMTVLLIDNNDDEFILLSKALYRLDKLLNCVHADSAESAIKILRNFSPHYIFIDLNMHEPTGLECIVQIRRLNNMQRTPLVVYSANISKGQWEKAKTSGANCYLQKTGSIVMLVDKLVSFFIDLNRSLFH